MRKVFLFLHSMQLLNQIKIKSEGRQRPNFYPSSEGYFDLPPPQHTPTQYSMTVLPFTTVLPYKCYNTPPHNNTTRQVLQYFSTVHKSIPIQVLQYFSTDKCYNTSVHNSTTRQVLQYFSTVHNSTALQVLQYFSTQQYSQTSVTILQFTIVQPY